MRTVDADRLKKSFEANTPIAFQDCVPGIHAIIDLEPTVEAEPVRHGHWIEHPFSAVFEKVHSKDQIVCSCCEEAFNAFFNETERFKYCPYCGAKMDEGKEE